MNKTPVIIIGMHRSGTSLLSRILERLGVFMGWKKEENNEALFFLKFNDWILRQVNASWDNPYNYLLAGTDFKALMAHLANKYLKSIRRLEYLGLLNFLRYKDLKDLNFPWGWKDPRNTFTLDIWLKVFPDAKIIHIYRNPIDVAESLRKRTLKYKRTFRWDFRKEIKLLLTTGYLNYGNSVRVENILEGIKLWKDYISRVFELEKKFDLNIMHIKYEKFLEQPFENIKEILDRIELEFNDEKLKSVLDNINPNRKYAFLREEYLVEVYNLIREDPILCKLGYDKLPT